MDTIGSWGKERATEPLEGWVWGDSFGEHPLGNALWDRLIPGISVLSSLAPG